MMTHLESQLAAGADPDEADLGGTDCCTLCLRTRAGFYLPGFSGHFVCHACQAETERDVQMRYLDCHRAGRHVGSMLDHEATCPEDIAIRISTYPGSTRTTTIYVCAACKHLYED